MMVASTLLLSLCLNPSLPAPNAVSPKMQSASKVDQPLPRRGTLGVSFSPLPPDQASKYSLAPGQGLIAQKPVAGLTAEKAGVQAGDIILTFNGKPVVAQTLGVIVRETPAGQKVSFAVARDGKTINLSATLMEKPRDPGNANYEVVYSAILSNGQRMRTIITKPKKPGKYPAFMFIQGFSPISYDYTLETAAGDVTTLDGPLLFDFANGGFVTMRVEKPGVGDSEGGPFAELDYITELDIYRQAIKQLKETSGVDTDNVFIFGHSMGGAFGPMIACETPVKGIAVYGTAAKTWYEYLLEILRYQGVMGSGNYEAADETVRQASRLMSLVLQEGKTVDEVKKSHPQLAGIADSLFPGGKFNGKTLKFWAQLGETNFATYWLKCNTHVLSVRGATDYVTFDADHKLIADIVNSKNPGWGKFVSVPDSDHVFHDWKTELESFRNFTKGKYNPAFSKLMMDWMRGLSTTTAP